MVVFLPPRRLFSSGLFICSGLCISPSEMLGRLPPLKNAVLKLCLEVLGT